MKNVLQIKSRLLSFYLHACFVSTQGIFFFFFSSPRIYSRDGHSSKEDISHSALNSCCSFCTGSPASPGRCHSLEPLAICANVARRVQGRKKRKKVHPNSSKRSTILMFSVRKAAPRPDCSYSQTGLPLCVRLLGPCLHGEPRCLIRSQMRP